MNTKLVAAIAAIALTVAACGGDGDGDETIDDGATTTAPTPTTTATTSTMPTTEAPGPTSTVPAEPEPLRNPLTGIVVDSEDEIPDRPALAVKIDNNEEQARENHTGLALADIVFEEIVENDDTRFAAVFLTNDSDPVGPIRSGRSQDVDILTSFNQPLFAWSGGNPGVTQLINASQLVSLADGSAEGFFRGPGRAPHNLYNSTPVLWAQTPPDSPGTPPQQYSYLLPDEQFAGEPAAGLDLTMRSNVVAWDWNADEARYLRSQAGTPHTDLAIDGEQIGATNVVVMVVEYLPSQIDARSPEAQTIGEGNVFIFSNGQVQRGTWSRETADVPIQFLDDDGEPIALTPGNTWIELAERDENPEPGGVNTQLVIR